MRHCIGRGEGLRIQIRLARNFLGLEQIALGGKKIVELEDLNRTLGRMVRDRRKADEFREAEAKKATEPKIVEVKAPLKLGRAEVRINSEGEVE